MQKNIKKEKLRFETDPHNRLIYIKTGRRSKVARYRKVLDGYFKTNKDNSLTYHIKGLRDTGIPQQVKLSGSWSMDKNHNLVFTLDKWKNQRNDR